MLALPKKSACDSSVFGELMFLWQKTMIFIVEFSELKRNSDSSSKVWKCEPLELKSVVISGWTRTSLTGSWIHFNGKSGNGHYSWPKHNQSSPWNNFRPFVYNWICLFRYFVASSSSVQVSYQLQQLNLIDCIIFAVLWWTTETVPYFDKQHIHCQRINGHDNDKKIIP